MRGIIIYPEIRRSGPESVQVMSGAVDPLMVRRATLYWDRIDRPHSMIMYMGLSPDEEKLKAAGILSETKIVDQFQTQDTLLEAPGRALLLLSQKEPGQWALAQSSPDLVLPNSLSVRAPALEVELHKALPIPAAETPIDDILQFKHKRRDELLAFRSSMDVLYERVVNAGDVPRAKDAALLDLEIALSNVHRVVGEASWKRVLSSLKVELSVNDLIAAGVFINQPLAKIVGGLASLKIGRSIVTAFKSQIPGLRDYAYLGYVEKELGGVAADTSASGVRGGGSITTRDGDILRVGSAGLRVGRNDACYCGSRKKFKKCHGAPA